MLLRFGKLHCLGDDLMLLDALGQHVQLNSAMIQQWSRRIQGVGFRRLVTVDIPREPEADFDCRVYDRNGSEVPATFVDLCCAARFLHDKRLTNQPVLQLQTAAGRVTVHVRGDGWIAAAYSGFDEPVTTGLPDAVQYHLELLAHRHGLMLSWQAYDKQLLVWADQAPPHRLHRLFQPVMRKLRGWQLLWLHSQAECVRVQSWQGEHDPAGHDPARLIANSVRQNMQQAAVQVEWQQDCLLLEFLPQGSMQLFARAWPVYEGQIRL